MLIVQQTMRPRRRGCRFMLQSVVAVLLLLFAAVVDASLVGFDSTFTSESSPFAVTECDATCTSPATVTLSLKLVRSGDVANTDTVQVSTRAPTTDAARLVATAGDDYSVLSSVTVVFAPSEKTKIVPLTIVSDGVYEEDEYFEAYLSNPSGGVTISGSATVAYIKIQDGGDAGIFAFSMSAYSFAENAGDVQVKVTRSGGSSGTVKATYRLANPTQATALNNKNFKLTDTTYQLTFTEGQRESFIPIKILNDAVYEAKEFFYLEISTLSPMKASDARASVAKFGSIRTAAIFITDDGDAGEFNFLSPYIYCREDNGSAVVSIARSLGTSSSTYLPVNLVVATVGSTGGSNATEGGSLAFDYLAKTEKLNWANGESRKTFAVKVFNNKRYDELPRAFKIRMTTVEGGAAIGVQSEMWVYVIDDRDAGTLSFKKPHYEVSESAATVVLEVVRTGLIDSSGVNTYLSGSVSVDVATYAGTIVPGLGRYDSDYDYDIVKDRRCTHVSPCTATAGVAYTSLASTTLTFADGEATKSVSIAILNNDLFEAPDKVFKVVLQNAAGGAHLGIDFEHPSEWYGYNDEFLLLDKRRAELPDNVGTIVSIQDDADPAVLLSRASLSLSEIGHYDSFDVWLNAEPTADVTVAFDVDDKVLALSLSTLVFTSANWNEKQTVDVLAVPNNQTHGLPKAEITISVSSSDAVYNMPLRSSLGSSGVVVAAATYTQLSGTYDTGNALHAFPWGEESGVMTSPLSAAVISVFIMDDDHAGVVLEPEIVRHSSGSMSPKDHVAVRLDGHTAIVNVTLASQPGGDVEVTLLPSEGISVAPATLIFTALSWSEVQSVEVAAIADLNTTEAVCVSVKVFVSSVADPFYDRPDEPIETLHVQRYPAALVLLDASVLEAREGDITTRPASYSLRLGGEPMHWEPQGIAYQPFELTIKAEADTTLAFSDDTEITSAPAGLQTTITAAANSSTSSPVSHIVRVGALRFAVNPSIKSSTGSHQVGSAIVRLYRLSGGENGGLGGISVGVAIASDTTPDDWDETTLQARCQNVSDVLACDVKHGTHTIAPSMFPGTTNFTNVSTVSAGEAFVTPTGMFNDTSNEYMPSAGWLDIDVTVALNDFLAKQFEREQRGVDFAHDLTLLIYTRSRAAFVFDGVNEVVFASKDHRDASLRPELRVVASGRVNLALGANVAQSHPGSAKAAIDGKTSSKLGVASTFAMSSVPYKYPWWQADLTTTRLIEEIVLTVKRKASSATLTESQLDVSLTCLLSNVSMTSDNRGLAGFTAAKAAALYQKEFRISTRSFTASDSDNVVLRWRVNGERDGVFGEDHFIANYSTGVEAKYLLVQVHGDNNIALAEVEIYQQPLAAARVALGGFMPSPSLARPGKNQIAFRIGEAVDTTKDCDIETDVCREELVFTSGNWRQPQQIMVHVFDDAVATGPRDVLLTHNVHSLDPDFRGSSVCDAAQVSDSEPCNPVLFSDSSVKILRIQDDDENLVLFSTSELVAEEGSGVYPHAPVVRREQRVFPASVRCSTDAFTVRSVSAVGSTSATPTTCAAAFDGKSRPWTVCQTDASANPLTAGSAWMMAGMLEEHAQITHIALTLPQMSSSAYVREISVYWNADLDVNGSLIADLLDISKGWTKLQSFQVPMKSSGVQTFELPDIALTPAKLVLVTFDKSYDDANHCVVAPHVAFKGTVMVPFPLQVRGDLSLADSVPPEGSRRSRMHQFGSAATLQVRLASEPVEDVVVSVVIEAQNNAISVYDAANASAVVVPLQDLHGGVYETGESVIFRAPTGLLFTPENWNSAQELAFLVVDDNAFHGNRTFSIRHAATSTDAVANVMPSQTFTSGKITRTFGVLSSALTYARAPFVVSTTRSTPWPHHRTQSWSSATGAVQVLAIDDDLPGVTLSQSELIVSESGPDRPFSVALDSAPANDVIVTISYDVDATLLTVAPLVLTFTPVNWMEPQDVVVHPIANDVYDAGSPLTIAYDRLAAKAKRTVLRVSVASDDASYDGISIGGNEPNRATEYVINQGVIATVQDDDTGCVAEFSCQNGGVCASTNYSAWISSSVCQCPATFGMKDCSAVCENARGCEFSRVAFRLQCRPGDATAICGDTFVPARLVATLYRMLTANAFTTSSGTTYPKLTLGAVSDVMYIVSSSAATCVDASAGNVVSSCVSVVMDFARAPGSDVPNPIVEKLSGYVEAGSLQAQPLYVELMTAAQQYPQSVGATVAVWVFLGFCGASVAGVAWLFSSRYVKLKKFHVTPQLDDASEALVPRADGDAAAPPHRHAQ